ncbi:VOC family protein [Nocardiopsis exhalans]|uniref:VOC family protein n=1 Tax=Nocardiopsis exhalans TaxID=163604 RepID=A0ABY5D4Q5_9ACTN|nr:VOC family protein [Nocardiopsis exhalans]USY18116.1 VOC family protein [Nocardiopsis exhalans]
MIAERPEFDHLLHWVPDVTEASAKYTAAGFPAHAGEAANGFQNGLWRLDERYVEIFTVLEDGAYGKGVFGRALTLLRPAIEDIAARGGGAMTFAVNVTDAAAAAQRLRLADHHVEEIVASPEGYDVSFREVFLPDAPFWAPFLITYDPPREQIFTEHAKGRFDPGPHDITAIVIQTADPRHSATWLGGLLGVPVRGTEVLLPGAHVLFEEGPEDRITGVVTTGPKTEIDGLAFHPEKEA